MRGRVKAYGAGVIAPSRGRMCGAVARESARLGDGPAFSSGASVGPRKAVPPWGQPKWERVQDGGYEEAGRPSRGGRLAGIADVPRPMLLFGGRLEMGKGQYGKEGTLSRSAMEAEGEER